MIVVFFYILLVFLLVLLNGFFVASEFAIVKVRSTRIIQLSEEGNLRAKVAKKLIANLDAYLSATQLGITFASLGLGWVGEPAIAKLILPLLKLLKIPNEIHHWIAGIIGFSIITFLHIVIGEMAPKSLAIRNAEKTALYVARPLHLFFLFFKPTIWILQSAANILLKWLGISLVTDHQQAHTEEEIRMLVAQSHKSGMIDQVELSLFDNIFDFADRVGREVMVPRVDMVCVYANDPLEKSIQTIQNSHYTRFPLCGRDKDDILGIIHIRDLYEQLALGKKTPLIKMIRPSILVPETMEIKDILRTLQKNKTELAIVIDEYGGTSGLVTIEDIVEEIVGEIQDEFDDEQPFFQKKKNATSIDARLLIDEVNEYFQLDIQDDDNHTIGGWFFSQIQSVPRIGSQVTYDSYQFIVQEMDQRSITRLLVCPSSQKKKAITTKPNELDLNKS